MKRSREALICDGNDYDITMCSVCENTVEEPKLLGCLHCVCKRCAIEKKSLDYKIDCPSCGQVTNVPDGDVGELRTPVFIEKMKEVRTAVTQAKKISISCEQCSGAPASAFCNLCRFICEKCVAAHKQLKKTMADHKLIDITAEDFDEKKLIPHVNRPQCKKHKECLTYYCCKCCKAICRDCYTIGNHKDHETLSLNERREINFTTLQEQLDRLSKTRLDKMNGHKKEIEKAKANIELNIEESRKKLNNWFSEANDVLQATHDELQAKLTEIDEKMEHALNVQLGEVQKSQLEIERVSRIVQSCLESDSDIDIATCHDVMVNKMLDLSAVCDVQHQVPAVPDNKCVYVTLQPKDLLRKWLQQSIRIMGPQADVQKSIVKLDDSQTPAVSEELTFTLTAMYENGQPCVTEQAITANVEIPNANTNTTPPPVTVVPPSNGTMSYKCSYTPLMRGVHKLHVFANGKEVRDSPVSFRVRSKSPTKIMNSASQHLLSLTQPYQIAFTSKGEFLVAESNVNGKILKLTGCNFKQTQEFRKNLPSSSVEYRPQGIATAADGSVYILYDGGLIVKYNQDGEVVTEHKYDESELKRPGRIQFNDDRNELYVCDRGSKCFQVYDSDLNLKRNFAKGHLYADIAFGNQGIMYLSLKEENSISVLNHEGREVYQFGNQMLSSPRGLLYMDNYLYVADRNNKRIVVFKATGKYQCVHHFTDEKFSDPGSVVSDKDGRLYVCDERRGQVLVFS